MSVMPTSLALTHLAELVAEQVWLDFSAVGETFDRTPEVIADLASQLDGAGRAAAPKAWELLTYQLGRAIEEVELAMGCSSSSYDFACSQRDELAAALLELSR